MKKYNVGDKVKCVETRVIGVTFRNLTLGKIYTIDFLMFGGDGIAIKDDTGYYHHFYPFQQDVLFEPFNMKNNFEIQNYEEWIEE